MVAYAPILVFFDVDRVLTYSTRWGAEAVKPLVRRLEHAQAPFVICSSRTRAEIDQIQLALGIRHPFVCECGSAAFIPTDYFPFHIPGTRSVAGYQAIEFGRPYAEVVRLLHQAASCERIEVMGFNDLSVEDVARECDLPLLQARLAKLREYGERFRVLSGNAAARPRLIRALQALRLRWTAGEPYDHVSAAADPSAPIRLLRALYKQAFGAVLAIGAGDVGSDHYLPHFFNRRLEPPNQVQRDGDVVKWMEAIVEAVEGLRRRSLELSSP
jgi:predicted mannosyl-3-phosphoglycerate phosphatase (HAD superfamily)